MHITTNVQDFSIRQRNAKFVEIFREPEKRQRSISKNWSFSTELKLLSSASLTKSFLKPSI